MEKHTGASEQFFIPIQPPQEANGRGTRGAGRGKNEKKPAPPEPYALEDFYERREEGKEQVATRIADVIMTMFKTSPPKFDTENVGAGKQFAEIQNELVKYMVRKEDESAFGDIKHTIQEMLIEKAKHRMVQPDVSGRKGKAMEEGVETVCEAFVKQFFTKSTSDGAMSEVRYIRSRAQEWGIIPGNPTEHPPEGDKYHRIMSNAGLDASHQTDVIEVTYTKDEEGMPERIAELRLVQVKTRELSPEEVEAIHRAHRAFARTCAEYPVEAFDLRAKREEVKTTLSERTKNALELVDLCVKLEETPQECAKVLSDASSSEEDAPDLIEHYTQMREYILSQRVHDEGAWDEALKRVNAVLERLSRVVQKKERASRRAVEVPVAVGRIVSAVVHNTGTACEEREVTGDAREGVAQGMLYRPAKPATVDTSR